MRIAAIFLFYIFSVFSIAGNINKRHTQMIVVTADDYSTSNATLQRYFFKNSRWQKVGQQIDIKIGKNGMGWGLGLHHMLTNAAIIKKEGDGKSPIGIFELGPAFGYEPYNVKYPYNVMTEQNHCVDDGKSRYYNTIIDSTKAAKDYNSYEAMKFPANYYKYGIVVKHNPHNLPGMGSCIFMHIKEIPTTGCDAMSEEQIKEIISWLDKKSNPILVQAPKSDIDGLLNQVK
jgi:L,D-peptidoglycan transpeptidase YkuD (ErfK/YbiS/YcfS/YnhG family)